MIFGLCLLAIRNDFCGTILSAIALEFPEGASRHTLGNPYV